MFIEYSLCVRVYIKPREEYVEKYILAQGILYHGPLNPFLGHLHFSWDKALSYRNDL